MSTENGRKCYVKLGRHNVDYIYQTPPLTEGQRKARPDLTAT
jgi:hypothetical protein